jgi:hypothetical protein
MVAMCTQKGAACEKPLILGQIKHRVTTLLLATYGEQSIYFLSETAK